MRSFVGDTDEEGDGDEERQAQFEATVEHASRMLIGEKRRKDMQAWSTRVSPIISSKAQ